jgi:hypothetical protein
MLLTTGGTTRRYRGGRSRETQDPEYKKEFEADNGLVSGVDGRLVAKMRSNESLGTSSEGVQGKFLRWRTVERYEKGESCCARTRKGRFRAAAESD